MQSLHPDFETTLPDTDYFFLGSGTIQAAIQWSRHPGATPLGILLSDPEHFSRKWSTHLFHPEYGLEKTMPAIILNGVRYRPGEGLQVVWFPDQVPGVTALWMAGDVYVIEKFWVSEGEPLLMREITFEANEPLDSAELELSLYANPALFSTFVGNEYGLGAHGFDSLLVSTHAPGIFHERTLRVPFYQEGDVYRMTAMYSLGPELPGTGLTKLIEEERDYWGTTCLRWASRATKVAHPSRIHHEIERVFTASAMGLRGAVGDSGRFDASIWQYGYEWSGDAANVAEALVYSGQFEAAQAVLENILARMTIPEGMAMESSRFRGGPDAELNNNGEILKACRTYLDWTGDMVFIGDFYDRIAAIANYLLLPEFLNAETGMLLASRDIWERNAHMGMLPGFDVAHQTFGILGLRDAAYLAKAFSNDSDRERWNNAARRMRQSFLEHPTHSMISDGRIIKRRLLDASIQTALAPHWSDKDFQKRFAPEGMPLSSKRAKPWEPDISECFPIALGLIDPRSEVSLKTLESLESLWSQAWEGGGYGRYNIASEPDSPGPWPLATMYMTAAYLEAGDTVKVPRNLEWLIDRAGAGGCWFEFYGERPTPPLPPTGILAWAWAEWITLVVKHILIARVEKEELIISPRLGGFQGELRFRDTSVAI